MEGRTAKERTRSAITAGRARRAPDTQNHTMQLDGAQPESPAEFLRRAEEELNAGMYHEALLYADGFIRQWGVNDRALCLRGISRVKYGIPQLFELGIADLEQASLLGNDEASQLLQHMSAVLAA